MSSLFDKIQGSLDDMESEGGVTPLDLIDLPPQLRKIMRYMLREVEITKEKLFKAVQGWKEEDRLSEEELEKTLKSLVKQSWLLERGEGENLNYRVYLRRKRASTLDSGIWNALDDKITERIAEAQKAKEELEKQVKEKIQDTKDKHEKNVEQVKDKIQDKQEKYEKKVEQIKDKIQDEQEKRKKDAKPGGQDEEGPQSKGEGKK